jgi:hypothetical protein
MQAVVVIHGMGEQRPMGRGQAPLLYNLPIATQQNTPSLKQKGDGSLPQ